MLEIVRRLSGVADIAYDPVVARSEFEHSARNAAIAWLMKSFGNFHNDVATVLQNYFHYCSLEMSCVELARTFCFSPTAVSPRTWRRRLLRPFSRGR
jgi:glutaminase